MPNQISDIAGTGADVRIPAGVNAVTPDQKDMFRAALEFERFFLSHLMKGMDAATQALKGEGGEDSSATTGAYTDMARDQMTQAMLDGGGIGLASMIYNTITGQQQTDGTTRPAPPAVNPVPGTPTSAAALRTNTGGGAA